MTQDPPASPLDQPAGDPPAPDPPAPEQPAPEQPDQEQPAPEQPDQVAHQSVPDPPAGDEPAPDPPASGEPGQPAQAGEPPSPTGGAAGAAAPRRRLVLLVAVGALAAIAIVVVGAFVVARLVSGGGGPEAGDCMNDAAEASEMRVVDCGSDEAVWSVLGVETGRTFGEFEVTPLEELCQAHPGSVQALWVTGAGDVTDSTDGDVVCLELLGPAPAGG